MTFLKTRSGAIGATARRIATVVAAASAFAGLVLTLFATATHVYPGGSDKASTILAGQAMSNGNFLLHGWIVPSDSFWTTDALFYALAVRAVGLRPVLFNLEPAVVVAVTILVGALVARQGRRGGAAMAGAVTVVALLALSTHALTTILLGGGYHISTALLALVAFAALRRGRFDWRWAAAVAALALGALGDLLMVAYGIVPVLCAAIVAILRERAWRAGIAALTASVAATILYGVASWLARAMGGFTLGPWVRVATAAHMLVNLRHVVSYGSGLLGATNPFGTGGVPVPLESVHVVGAATVVVCSLVAMANLAKGVVRGRRGASNRPMEIERWWLEDVLLIAMFGSATTFVALAVTGLPAARYLAATVVFASVLSGRIIAQAWQRLRPGWATRSICILAAAVSSCFAAGLGCTLAQPVPTQSAATLVSWLEAHHLRNGVGGYWAANITTVESRGVITVRPVWSDGHGGLGRSMYESSAGWYAGQHFRFLVYLTPPYEGVDTVSATNTWGCPAHTYIVDKYHVLVWSVAFSVAPFPASRHPAQAAESVVGSRPAALTTRLRRF